MGRSMLVGGAVDGDLVDDGEGDLVGTVGLRSAVPDPSLDDAASSGALAVPEGGIVPVVVDPRPCRAVSVSDAQANVSTHADARTSRRTGEELAEPGRGPNLRQNGVNPMM